MNGVEGDIAGLGVVPGDVSAVFAAVPAAPDRSFIHPAPASMTTPSTQSLPRVFLASRSPRRRELLTQYGIDHEAQHPGFDDSLLRPGRTSPRTWVSSLAHLKALAGLEILEISGREKEFEYVLGADTTCVRDGCMLGTPADAAEARGILQALRGGRHEVITGVALVRTRDGDRTLFADGAWVTWGDVSDEEIDRYVAGGKWQGKAGAYNLHDRIDAGWPITFEGDPSTITGLPMGMLTRVLRQLVASPPATARGPAGLPR